MPMPLWVPSVVSGIAATAGGLFSNHAQRAAADRANKFSERMASTQAQRAVKDYAAAGLNPALAYGNPAAAPSGLMGRPDDAVGKGISTALAVKQQEAQLKLLEAQTGKTQAETTSIMAPFTGTTPGEPTYRDELMARRRKFFRDVDFEGTNQPHQSRLIELEKILKELSLPGARNTAAFERRMGELRPGSPMLFSAARLLSDFLSRR